MIKHLLGYFFIRLCLFPIRFLSFRSIHAIGNKLGLLVYFCHHRFRKKSLSNLALAKDLNLSKEQMVAIAKQSFQNLAITCLEYEKFSSIKKTSSIIYCKNPQVAHQLIQQGQGIIFFCGHQANWETLFLDGTQKMPGLAIGRPIKNPYLYRWIKSIREKFGGRIIAPQHALKEGLKGLKQGFFLGIVGDQGMPEHGFFHPFLKQKAWTSPAPALLAYKTKCPIIVATTQRVKGRYEITYSDPIWPDFKKTIDEEMPKMMSQLLYIFEKSIKKNPGQWLWQHNRFKQETPKTVYYRYRHDCLLVILPKEKDQFLSFLPSISLFQKIYPKAFLTFYLPLKYKNFLKSHADIITYQSEKELFITDYKYKCIFNFSGVNQLKKHFLKQAALKVVNFDDLKKEAQKNDNSLSGKDDVTTIITKAICRKGVCLEPHHGS